MSAFDYSRPLATARRLIARFGRVVAFQAVTEGPADPDNPLAGPAAPPDPVPGVPAVFVEPSGLKSLGADDVIIELTAKSKQIAIVAQLSGLPDLSSMSFIIDNDNSTWKIDTVSTLKPGDTIILYFFGISRP
jgi:hypothetical protein